MEPFFKNPLLIPSRVAPFPLVMNRKRKAVLCLAGILAALLYWSLFFIRNGTTSKEENSKNHVHTEILPKASGGSKSAGNLGMGTQEKQDILFSRGITPTDMINKGFVNPSFGLLDETALSTASWLDLKTISKFNELVSTALVKLCDFEKVNAKIKGVTDSDSGRVTELQLSANSEAARKIRAELSIELLDIFSMEDSKILDKTLNLCTAFSEFKHGFSILVADINGTVALRGRGNLGEFDVSYSGVNGRVADKMTVRPQASGKQGDRVMFTVKESSSPSLFKLRWGYLAPQ